MADIPDPIAEKLRAEVVRTEEQKAAASGERLLQADFETVAIQGAPEEFKKLATQLRDRGAAINQARPAQIPELRFAEVNHRLEAGKFAIELQPIAGLRDYIVRVIVGLHPNAYQFMAEVPNVPSSIRDYSASADETGFFWLDNETGMRPSADEIVADALESLTDLLAADHRGDLYSDDRGMY